ncbi:MAG: tagaturonate epimerase family protein [Gemmataceae bacterium]|nr:tagaturonate epimerase family protein [Gemmata sp.]MDW8199299.1 tagaturonate epimerase family protein [Gemmataceae bacterium]
MGSQVQLPKYSIGVGDRFGHQAPAQLRACQMALEAGVEVIPVWNKSNREHTLIGSEPSSVRAAAAAAVAALGWKRPYFVDADHIRLDTVERFLSACDYFTIDVADAIGQPVDPEYVQKFISCQDALIGRLRIPGVSKPFTLTRQDLEQIARHYFQAIREAAAIYRKIAQARGAGQFITEVSMDETDTPQTPAELLVILAALAFEQVPVQTIAPKFTGRFNKGVDYVGDVRRFEREFRDDLAVIAFAVKEFGLPSELKLSIHSGSDKFSLYPLMRQALRDSGAGLHLKTAGTTWLEELIGLAESGPDGLALVKDIYTDALNQREALCRPYATVIDINPAQLPAAEVVQGWTAAQFIAAVRHNPTDPAFNPSFRQLLHVSFKVAAQMGARYLQMLQRCEDAIAPNVTRNLYERHIKPLFIG